MAKEGDPIQQAAAVAEWRKVLGETSVSDDDATLDRYARSTYGRGTRPVCVLYPVSTGEVQSIVRIANASRTVLYPVSRGKNWGYGDACAPTEGAAIVDLSRMNRILEVNTELAYAVIEPGVSQRQLYQYLQEHSTGLWMDCTGAGPDASILGNTLDRGFGHTRYGDHFTTACGMEIVLPDSRILNTGFGHYGVAKAARVYPYGVGPYMDGLFCQSNLGIVTRLGIWLMPAPEAFCNFFVSVKRPVDLAPLVDCLRPLRMGGILPTTLHIGNDLRVVSGNGPHGPDYEPPLTSATREALQRSHGIGAWNAAGALVGTRGHVRASKRALRKAVGRLGRLIFVGGRKLALGEGLVRVLQRAGLGKTIAEQLEAVKPVASLMKGAPTAQPLLGAQWGLHTHVPVPDADPLDLGCGLMWVSPVVPMTGRDALALMHAVEPVFSEHGFDPLVTFTMINERAMVAIMNMAYDLSAERECERARACYDALMGSIMAEGYVPYRVGLQGMAKLHQPGDVFWDVALQIKQALDPADIIASGRYIPSLHKSQ